MHQTQTTTSRRRLLQGGLLASLALVASLGALPISDAAASKNDGRKPKSIAKRAEVYRRSCVAGGGTATESKKLGGTTVACTDSNAGNWSCTVHSKGSRCHATRTEPTGPTQPLQPETPFADPSDGTDQPLEPDSPFANPGDAPDQPLEPNGGGVTITACDGGTHVRARRRAKRHRHGHGNGRKA